MALVSTMGAPQPVNDYDVRSDRTPVVADRVHLQLLTALDVNTPRFLAARFPGIDAVGHRFLRYADPIGVRRCVRGGDQRFGRVLQQYYGFLDTLVARELERLGPNDLLLVVSGFGMEPMSPGKRVLELIAGNPQISGTHDRRRMVSFLRLARRYRRAGNRVHRWSISPRRFCISWGYRSAATWMGSHELTCSNRPLRAINQ